MTTDATNGIIWSMVPVFLLLIGVIAYSIITRSKRNNEKHDTREKDALIQAQAMLAKYQQENKDEEEKSEDPKEEKIKESEKPKEESKSKSENKPKKLEISPEKKEADLEPDIDTKID